LKKYNCDLISILSFNNTAFRKILRRDFSFKSSFDFPYKKVLGWGYLEVLLIDDTLAKYLDVYCKENWRVIYAYPDYT
jgi:hypothetical protein